MKAMTCTKTHTQLPLDAGAVKSEGVPVRVGKFLRLAGTSDLQDKRERRLQAIRRYKAKLKAETRIDGRLFRFVFRNPEYRRIEKTIDWKKVFAESRSEMKPIPLSEHFQAWAATGDANMLRFLSVLLALNYRSICEVKHNHVSQMLFKRPSQRMSREKRKEVNAKYRDYRKEYYKKRRTDPEYVAQLRKQCAVDFQKHKQRIYAYRNNRRKTDPQYKISSNLRTYIYQRVGKKNTTGQSRFREIVGCSIEEFCKWLESHLAPWMNWTNYGSGPGQWSIDHTRCCASFDLTDPEQVKQCFHYSNMKPMLHRDNLSKSDKLPAIS